MWYFLSQKVGGKIFANYWKVLVLNFSLMGNIVFFLVKKLMEKIIFTDYGQILVLNFSVEENTVFFESRSWWKNDIYWLQKSSWFELLGGGKYGLFWVKELMERWYLLVTENFLFWTLRWWEIWSFFQPKSWWKDYIYLVCLRFPWYFKFFKN